jgi:ABC-type bacteriocin/lantibiotic exporter with double-glycine peptidase domain
MQSKLIFHKQETLYSCVPACLRMVLSAFEVDISEVELRQQCDCTAFGTEALKAVDAVRNLGFSGTAKCTLTINELYFLLEVNLYPIVFVNLLPIDGVKVSHAMIVVAIAQEIVTVYDPLQGERNLPHSTFDTAWAMMHNLAILVQN